MLAQSLLTPAVALWVLGVLLVPAIGWALTVTVLLWGAKARQTECLGCHAEMLKMHRNADEYGFGTVALRARLERDQEVFKRLIEDNTRAMREVAHYIRWWIESQTGKTPPPPLPAEVET